MPDGRLAEQAAAAGVRSLVMAEVSRFTTRAEHECPDCGAPAGRSCYGHCPRYAERPDDE